MTAFCVTGDVKASLHCERSFRQDAYLLHSVDRSLILPRLVKWLSAKEDQYH